MRNSGSGGTAAGAYVRLFFVGSISLLCGAEAWGQVTFASTQFSTPAGVLAAPAGVAADGKGHVWIADQGSNRVVEFTSTGTGFGAAVVLATGLASPSGVAVDWSGNVYVADTGNNQILMIPVTLNGYSSPQTVAIGLNSPGGVAVDSAGNLYVADTGNNRIVELPKTGNSFGPAATVGTGFSNPAGVALDSARNIYVADTGNNRIVKEPLLAGMYATQQVLFRNMSAPMGLAVDKSGNVFIADTGNNRIVEEPWAAGANRYGSLMVLGSGFAAPGAVAEDLTGNVFIADTGNQRLTEVVAKSVAFGAVASGAASTTLTYNFNVAAGTTLGNVNVFLQGVTGKDFVDAGGSTCLPSTYVVATICAVNVGFMPQGSGLRLGAVVLLDGDGNSLATAFLSGSGLLPQLAFFPGTSMALGRS